MTTLPEFMIGDFQMETSEGFNDFMYEMGVNFVTRNIANNLYPLQKITQDPADEMVTLGEDKCYDVMKFKMFHTFHSLIETLTSFKSTKIEFKLGEEFDEFTADGRDCKTIATVEGRKLIKVRIIYSFVQFD